MSFMRLCRLKNIIRALGLQGCFCHCRWWYIRQSEHRDTPWPALYIISSYENPHCNLVMVRLDHLKHARFIRHVTAA